MIHDYPHEARSGFVLPDSVASAFFGACDRVDRKKPPNPDAAHALDKVIARRSGRQEDYPAHYGLTLFPDFQKANLDAEQARIFQHFGCDKKR